MGREAVLTPDHGIFRGRIAPGTGVVLLPRRITTCDSMTEEPTPATRQSQIHRGPRIVAVEPGNDWVGTVHAPDSNAILASLEGASAQEVMVRGTEAISLQLAGRLVGQSPVP
jgi:hypothetical protein